LGLLSMPEQTANFNWGGENLSSIYLAASTTLYRVKVKNPGPTFL
jgi:gluconolactonase